MDENSVFSDAWWGARIGKAIDAGIDRIENKPQYNIDPAKAYGVDQNGNLYQLGQTNAQLTAQITTKPTISPTMLILLAVAAVVLLGEGK